jgi:transposase-like protein
MKKALKRHGKAEAIVTDGLKSYPAAMRDLGNLDRREMGLVDRQTYKTRRSAALVEWQNLAA